jgi:hypothetical protein
MIDKSIYFSKILWCIHPYYTLATNRNCGCISNFRWLNVSRHTTSSGRKFEVACREIWGDVVHHTGILKVRCWQSHINLGQKCFLLPGFSDFWLEIQQICVLGVASRCNLNCATAIFLKCGIVLVILIPSRCWKWIVEIYN